VFQQFIPSGIPVTIKSTPDSIALDIPDNILAYQVQVQYPVGSLIVTAPSNENKLSLVKNDESAGIFTMLVKKGEEQFLSLPVVVKGRGADVKVSFRAVGRDGEIISQVTKDFHVEGIPESYALHQNYPNPFNPVTKIEYDIPGDGNVSLVVYDVLGRQVITLVNGFQTAGYHDVLWDGTDERGKKAGAGIYIYRFTTAVYSEAHKMVLLK
jgi:hypothetical protein